MSKTPVADLSYHWMRLTANHRFKSKPRLLVSAEGMHSTSADGHQILDGTAGSWCVNAGHGNAHIESAIKRQVDELDCAPAFQMSHPSSFELAARLSQHLPEQLDRVFYTN